MIGIYGIRNTVNGKIYVGQTADIHRRWMVHRSDLKKNKHHNKHLQAAWNKYGKDAFLFFVIEECDASELDGYETFWINYYQSRYTGYNLDLGGKGTRGYKHTQEEIDKMIQIQHPKRVVQLDLNMNYIATWVSAATAGKTLGHQSYSGIKRCCEKDKYKKAYGFIWMYEEDWLSGNIDYDYYLSENPSAPIRISQYDSHMNLIKTFDSIYQLIKETEYNSWTIRSALDVGKHKKAYGFVWRRTDEYKEEQYLQDVAWDYSKRHPTRITPVEQYDLDWNYIATYPSMTEAIEANPTVSKNIYVCFKEPHRTCGGFHWKRAETQ